MKLLDKYIAKNFFIGYSIVFCVMIGLRIVIDLFLSLDEFTEHTNLGTLAVVKHILSFYALHSTLYFRDFAGMITVFAAVFSLFKMVRNNELVAVMASGVSLKRVICPIVLLALLMTGLFVIDQELIIPPLSDKLVRRQDAVPGQESYDIEFLIDGKGSLIRSPKFDVKTSTLHNPHIIIRRKKDNSLIWDVIGRISADKAVYDPNIGEWILTNGWLTEKDPRKSPRPYVSYKSDITPKDIPVRRKSRHLALLSLRQLAVLAAQRTKIKDKAQLYSQKHFRITEPIINLAMLMVCLPILVCRDPKSMKSAVAISFGVTMACFITTFVCKMLATEVFFDRVIPELWAWMPVVIFMPIAFIELDSMKT
ncbi:MAG: LptF/LptG family permease [Phycisphaerae bacterium]|nr:YjgP/YjgQ family permease [Phycisphaerae bacterium]NIP54085.1 YjgP/YjgQ family permease [Phycisphaerae bacterium]NIS53013.1 YjgP/YjgQ family permease [Phycisphaerae bacterium]NIU10495.1 YjgP/YjgQ family permease [Phycisphaerae bacterium]NIU58283.1 LptF/LptG family permease [Phycisphaerae bacterium]